MAAEKLELLMSRGKLLPHDAGLSYTECDSMEELSEEKLRKGISFFSRNFFSMFVSMLTGLLSLMYIETIASVLYTTNKSSSGVLSFQARQVKSILTPQAPVTSIDGRRWKFFVVQVCQAGFQNLNGSANRVLRGGKL